MTKVTVHTESGDVCLGDICCATNGKAKFIGLDTIDMRPYYIRYLDSGLQEYTDNIRPLKNPEPLTGLELARKLALLFMDGWEAMLGDGWISLNPRVTLSMSGVICIDGFRIEKNKIRAPRTDEWMCANQVTEETGK